MGKDVRLSIHLNAAFVFKVVGTIFVGLAVIVGVSVSTVASRWEAWARNRYEPRLHEDES